MSSDVEIQLLRLELERARLDLARAQSARPVVLALRKREAAQAIGLSERTLHRLIERGEIPAKRTDGAVLVQVAELQRWLDAASDHVSKQPARGGEAVPGG